MPAVSGFYRAGPVLRPRDRRAPQCSACRPGDCPSDGPGRLRGGQPRSASIRSSIRASESPSSRRRPEIRLTTARSRDWRRNSVATTWRATPMSQAAGLEGVGVRCYRPDVGTFRSVHVSHWSLGCSTLHRRLAARHHPRFATPLLRHAPGDSSPPLAPGKRVERGHRSRRSTTDHGYRHRRCL